MIQETFTSYLPEDKQNIDLQGKNYLVLRQPKIKSRENKNILITGPTGVGKTTLIRELAKTFPDQSHQVVSTTTRAPRPTDEPGDYIHMSVGDFLKKKDNGDFLIVKEYVNENGISYYAYDKTSFKYPATQLISTISVQNSKEYSQTEFLKDKTNISVFVTTSTIERLREQLEARCTLDNLGNLIDARWKNVEIEMRQMKDSDIIVINRQNELSKTVRQFYDLISSQTRLSSIY